MEINERGSNDKTKDGPEQNGKDDMAREGRKAMKGAGGNNRRNGA